MRKYIPILAALTVIAGMLGCAAREEAEAPADYTETAEEEYYYGEGAAEDYDYGAFPGEKELAKRSEPDTALTDETEPTGGEIPPAPGPEEVTFADVDASETTRNLMIIKTADLTFEVSDVDKATYEVVTIVSTYNAFILDSHKYKDEYGSSYSSVTIRIKPEYFEKAIRDIHAGIEGTLLDEQITGEDVTAEYIDVKARLDNKLEVQKRYLDLLARRTATVSDILDVERELERVGEDVERLKGQLRYIENRVALSTITVNVQEPMAAVPGGKRTFWEDIKDAFRIMIGIVIFLIQALIVLSPFVVILIIVVIIARAIIIHYVRKGKKA